ncbi:MAG: DEAD/DEAH box helicase, partial [Bacteroidota bacterium]
MEQAASLLQYVHGPAAEKSRESAFHILLSAMAFYAAGHYSRAFVTIRQAEGGTEAAQIVAAFLRKDFSDLVTRLNDLLFRDPPEINDQRDLDEWAIMIAVASSIAGALEFVFTGREASYAGGDSQLRDAAIVASAGDQAAWWWIVRLLRLMLTDLGEASPWRVLPPYFSPDSSAALAQFVRLLAFGKRPVIEFWSSQRSALPLALDSGNRGGVINLRTSAGKTRVAELAILQTLLSDSTAKVFYLAPFRSLALEVEQTLSSTFKWLGFSVSHLYGGSRVSSIDTELATDSHITIATPEKARALFRAVPELSQCVKLLVIDEGHLLGRSERYVRNEIFIDHFRALARNTGLR